MKGLAAVSLNNNNSMQGNSTESFSNSKTSRISLVDLAGPERYKVNEDEKHYTKEGKQVLKSLSSLGYDSDIIQS